MRIFWKKMLENPLLAIVQRTLAVTHSESKRRKRQLQTKVAHISLFIYIFCIVCQVYSKRAPCCDNACCIQVTHPHFNSQRNSMNSRTSEKPSSHKRNALLRGFWAVIASHIISRRHKYSEFMRCAFRRARFRGRNRLLTEYPFANAVFRSTI